MKVSESFKQEANALIKDFKILETFRKRYNCKKLNLKL